MCSRRPATVRAVGEGIVLRHRQGPLPHAQRMPANVAGSKVAGAYVRSTVYRRADSKAFALVIGGRKSRTAEGQARVPEL